MAPVYYFEKLFCLNSQRIIFFISDNAITISTYALARSSVLTVRYIPVIFQVASLLAALAHPGHIVIYAPGDSLPCRRDAS
ncbi:hypothetical protein C5467_07490 [Photorhabdus khanii subsp. guanajuatensis]|uniref:Uncharacterized protein n=1 Tax=Photorhabdus khanii subsp. guanajuatensis TaxID=2100166 RepID=A0A4R4JZZ7_9GAMM|nr:hypothetical protein C5467_07490 [Photorhabdus khanii subsp. guanajuatensis]